MNGNERDQVLALAGVFQSAMLVQQLAHRGQCDEAALEISLRSIFKLEAESTDAIFGETQGLRLGLQAVHDKLGGAPESDNFEIARYVIALTQLTKKLLRQNAMMSTIGSGIERIKTLLESHAEEGERVPDHLIEQIAELYAETISTLNPRIIVSGEQGFLSSPLTAAKVRATLLAGIRAATLWLQLGGKRWHLLFKRTKITEGAANLLKAT